MQRLDVDRGRGRYASGRRAEPADSPLEQLRAPLRDLVRMHIELLRQFRQRCLAANGRKRHLRFESRTMIPAWSFAHRLSCSRPPWPASGRQSTYPAVQMSQATSVHAMAQQKAQQLLGGNGEYRALVGCGVAHPLVAKAARRISSRIAAWRLVRHPDPDPGFRQMPGAAVLRRARRVPAVVLHPVPCPEPRSGQGITVGTTTSTALPVGFPRLHGESGAPSGSADAARRSRPVWS